MLWIDKLSNGIIYIGLPVVSAYHLVCGNIFLNTAAEDAQGFEYLGDLALAPVQYILCGQKAIRENNHYSFVQRFDYSQHYALKTTASFLSLPVALPLGSLLKGLAYLGEESRNRHENLYASKSSTHVDSQIDYYKSLGLNMDKCEEPLVPMGYARESAIPKHLGPDLTLLKEIAEIFEHEGIPYWIDCGTCLGAIRYGGAIPWDLDVDIGVLRYDHDNILRALNRLDPEKYHVQDWSNRSLPKTYIRVYVKENHNHLDIYHFDLDQEKQELHSILSNESSYFMLESWKIRERRFTISSSFDVIFPLRKALFDGIEVNVPNQTKKYLQERYGQNLDPVKKYNPISGEFEKDLNHPYWQIPFVH